MPEAAERRAARIQAAIAAKGITSASINDAEAVLPPKAYKPLAPSTLYHHDTEIEHLKAYLELRQPGSSHRHLQLRGEILPLQTLKGFVKHRTSLVEGLFEGGRTSVIATEMRTFSLIAALNRNYEHEYPKVAKQELRNFISTLDLYSGTLPKAIASAEDFMMLISSAWSAGAGFRHRRERLQMHAFFQCVVMDMGRPGEIAPSSHLLKDPDNAEGLRYKDLSFYMAVADIPNDKGEVIKTPELRVEIKYRNLKGKKRVEDHKVGLHRQLPPSFAGFDATLSLLAISLEDDVFKHVQSCEQLEAITVEEIKSMGGKLHLQIKEDEKSSAVFKEIVYDKASGWHAGEQPMAYRTCLTAWQRLMRLCGFKYRTRQGMAFTTLRRMYQNLCEANGVPESDRKQAVGHNPRSASYLQSYKSATIAVNTKKVVLGLSAPDFDPRVMAMGMPRVPDAVSGNLPLAFLKAAAEPEGMKELRESAVKAKSVVIEKYGSLTAAKLAQAPEHSEYINMYNDLNHMCNAHRASLLPTYQDVSTDKLSEDVFKKASARAGPSSHPNAIPMDTVRSSVPGQEIPLALIDPLLLTSDEAEAEMEDADAAVELADVDAEDIDAEDTQLQTAEETATIQHPPALQALVEQHMQLCNSSVLPIKECEAASRLQEALFPATEEQSWKRCELVQALIEESFLTNRLKMAQMGSARVTTDLKCPVVGCSKDFSKTKAAQDIRNHMYSCLTSRLVGELWDNWSSAVDLPGCPFEGCKHHSATIFNADNARKFAEHVYYAHCQNGASSCRVRLADGPECGVGLSKDVQSRSRHYSSFHSLLSTPAPTIRGKRKKGTVPAEDAGEDDDEAEELLEEAEETVPAPSGTTSIPGLPLEIQFCAPCQLWIRGLNNVLVHAHGHLHRDLQSIFANPLSSAISFATREEVGEAAACPPACPICLADQSLDADVRWFTRFYNGTHKLLVHINHSHLWPRNDEQACPFQSCHGTFSPQDFAEHLQSAHHLKLMDQTGLASRTTQLSGASPTGESSNRKRRKMAVDEKDSDLMAVSQLKTRLKDMGLSVPTGTSKAWLLAHYKAMSPIHQDDPAIVDYLSREGLKAALIRHGMPIPAKMNMLKVAETVREKFESLQAGPSRSSDPSNSAEPSNSAGPSNSASPSNSAGPSNTASSSNTTSSAASFSPSTTPASAYTALLPPTPVDEEIDLRQGTRYPSKAYIEDSDDEEMWGN